LLLSNSQSHYIIDPVKGRNSTDWPDPIRNIRRKRVGAAHHFRGVDIGWASQKYHSRKHLEDRRDTDLAAAGRWVVANRTNQLTGVRYDMKGLQEISREV
jgi:hypothetical protein